MPGLIHTAWSRLRAHPRLVVVAAVVVLVVALPVANYLLSPLWTRTALHEASPLDVAASVAATAPGGPAPTTPAPNSAAPVGTTPSGGPPAATKAAASAGTPAPAPSAATPASPAGAAATAAPAAPTSTPPVAAGPRVVARGMFAGADDFHFGRGDALLIEVSPQRYTLRFENFSVRNGPDLFVYLSDDAGGYGKSVLKLGGLRATDGAFNYEVPAGTDVTRFRSAIVWCDQFSQLFATATLR